MSKRERQQGQLEAAILDALWSASAPLTSAQVRDAVNADEQNDVAITTVLTVLSRLVDKGQVTRADGEGRSLLFSAAQTREQHTAGLMLDLFAGSTNPTLAFSHFASGLSAEQLKQLRESLGDE
jgi:predicted transcriptional regulator